MNNPILQLKGFDFAELFLPEALGRLDKEFLNYINEQDANLATALLNYRQTLGKSLSPLETSEFLIKSGPLLGNFIVELFGIGPEVNTVKQITCSHQVIFDFKAYYVQKQAKRRLNEAENLPGFGELEVKLEAVYSCTPHPPPTASTFPARGEVKKTCDKELNIAKWGMDLLQDPDKNADIIEQLVQWCIQAMVSEEGQLLVQDWVSFKLPKKLDYENLVPTVPYLDLNLNNNNLEYRQGRPEQHEHRDGFVLTDVRMSERQVLGEIDYCVYCHKNEGDFCSKGFPVKKAQPELGLKKNPLGEILTGCPLEEKISEMHVLKKQGQTIAALAVIMVDNPMCPITGHRICNDCMRACIYQKQEPVDIPQTETGILGDVLSLPWGVEIYDLLTRWNPLRPSQWVAKPYNGSKIMVMGMGPAGFTLAHHLLMEGFAVVGAEGLKIEALKKEWLKQPIYNYESLKESLDTRIMAGFGGVAEYGITVRWDKNFLKLIYISLMRRPYFQVFGGLRFGGTLRVEDVWELGFDHLALAVGAGLPKELPIPGSLAPGMRQANDFLMALQLTGAAKKSSLANLQVRLPAVIIGGGLTGVDTATEVQAYYIVQVEKALLRFNILLENLGEDKLKTQFDDYSWEVLQEFLEHGRAVAEERRQAVEQGRSVNFIPLLQQWGGVTIAYRKSMQESPAYLHNYEEINLALREGVFYAEYLEPNSVNLDEHGYVKSLICKKTRDQEEGELSVTLPARSIFVATGARPNVAYEFEHAGTFKRKGFQYELYENTAEGLQAVPLVNNLDTPIHCKIDHFGPFTSYLKDHHRISMVGDTHPVFHGSVVKAVASGKRIYPIITESLGERAKQKGDDREYQYFAEKMQELMQARVVSVKRLSVDVIELEVIAKMAAHNFQPGQFYRVQNFETEAKIINGTSLQTEGIALLGTKVNKQTGHMCFVVLEKGTSSRLFAHFRPGDPIAIMGPTGVKTKIPDTPETILMFCDRQGIPYVSVVGADLKAAGSKVRCFVILDKMEDLYFREELEAACDELVLIVPPLRLFEPPPPARGGGILEEDAEFLANTDRIIIAGKTKLIKTIQTLRHGFLRPYLIKNPKCSASIYGPMQCMLKGVCAQCLQWQIDPSTGKRTKAVFTCSWQDQPVDSVDINNLDERLIQNRMQEILSNLWLDYIITPPPKHASPV